MGSLLTKDGNNVNILTSIAIDKSLPKYKRIEEVKFEDSDGDSFGYSFPQDKPNLELLSYENLKKHLEKRNNNITSFNYEIGETLNKVLSKTTFEGISLITNSVNLGLSTNVSNFEAKKTFWTKLKELFGSKKANGDIDKLRLKEFDVIKFFSDVHGFVESETASKYIDRITEYIEYIGYVEMTGQTALKERLIKNLIINKLESILYANGFYKAIDEEVIVKFAHEAPKALCLDYIRNFTRNIPVNVIKKKIEADKLEVFDNYCVLHYDPEDNGTEMTDEEREKEVRKRKDPILFGLINGSNKLYYIGDWVDEYCDLTLDKIVETLGKEMVESSFIKENINVNKE